MIPGEEKFGGRNASAGTLFTLIGVGFERFLGRDRDNGIPGKDQCLLGPVFDIVSRHTTIFVF